MFHFSKDMTHLNRKGKEILSRRMINKIFGTLNLNRDNQQVPHNQTHRQNQSQHTARPRQHVRVPTHRQHANKQGKHNSHNAQRGSQMRTHAPHSFRTPVNTQTFDYNSHPSPPPPPHLGNTNSHYPSQTQYYQQPQYRQAGPIMNTEGFVPMQPMYSPYYNDHMRSHMNSAQSFIPHNVTTQTCCSCNYQNFLNPLTTLQY
uniref:Uncharacterized protein n=1 Tax=Cacopsylla melanoneura TaxID=428564 RepID=A0A8D9E6I6_9HEMI